MPILNADTKRSMHIIRLPFALSELCLERRRFGPDQEKRISFDLIALANSLGKKVPLVKPIPAETLRTKGKRENEVTPKRCKRKVGCTKLGEGSPDTHIPPIHRSLNCHTQRLNSSCRVSTICRGPSSGKNRRLRRKASTDPIRSRCQRRSASPT